MYHVCMIWNPFNQIRQYTALSLPEFKKPQSNKNVYDLQALIVKWYCNSDRGSEGLLHHLHCFTLGSTLQFQQQKHSKLKAKTHNMICLFRWSYKALELIFTYIHHSLASLSALFKCTSLSFVNLSLFSHHVSIFWLEHRYILPKTSETSLEGAPTLMQNWHS